MRRFEGELLAHISVLTAHFSEANGRPMRFSDARLSPRFAGVGHVDEANWIEGRSEPLPNGRSETANSTLVSVDEGRRVSTVENLEAVTRSDS